MFSRHLRVLAADAPKLHGLTPSLAIIDELHAHPDDDVYLALRTATLKRPGSRLITISHRRPGRRHARSAACAPARSDSPVVRRGAFTDARGPNLRMLEWSVPEDDRHHDAGRVKKANPASWITTQRAPRAARSGRRGRLPPLPLQPVDGPGRRLAPRRRLASLRRRDRVHATASGSGSASTSAANARPSAVVYVNENLHVGVETWTGDDAVLEVADLRRRARRAATQIVEAVYDPWRAGQMAQEWEQRGIPAVAFPQIGQRA